jgi:hypothetical protein
MMAALSFVLAGCQDTREILGMGKRTPDEFAVYSRAPLSVPPNYGLRPPGSVTPGAPQPGAASTDARSAVLGRPTASAGAAPAAVDTARMSSGTVALLQRTGGLTADPNIRKVINRESTILAEVDQSFTERLMFWRTPNEYGTVIDPEEEAKRIRENQALGKPVTEGQTPTIQRRRRALLEGIFN